MSAAAEKPLFKVPTADDINALKEEFGLSSTRLGKALGYDDDGRTVRAWLTGERHGKPFVPTQNASAAFWYFAAMMRAIADGEQFFGPEALAHLRKALGPEFTR